MSIHFAQLQTLAGHELGTSGWRGIEQERVDLFADATDDHQWIHIDGARAEGGPFSGTIAHGYLTLSLVPSLLAEVLDIPDRRLALNYGVEKIRFTSAVPVGTRIRLRARVVDATARTPDRILLRIGITIEVENEERPAVVGEVLTLVIGPEQSRGAPPTEGERG